MIVLVRDKETVSVRVADGTCLNHVAQLATFLGSDIEIHLFAADGAKWIGRGQCYPAEPRAGQMPLLVRAS